MSALVCELRLNMALFILPFFMPLFLLGWVLTPREERDLIARERVREREFAATWGQLYASESHVNGRSVRR